MAVIVLVDSIFFIQSAEPSYLIVLDILPTWQLHKTMFYMVDCVQYVVWLEQLQNLQQNIVKCSWFAKWIYIFWVRLDQKCSWVAFVTATTTSRLPFESSVFSTRCIFCWIILNCTRTSRKYWKPDNTTPKKTSGTVRPHTTDFL